jgi:hypothetical protein
MMTSDFTPHSSTFDNYDIDDTVSRNSSCSRPKPRTAYSSISTTLRFKHHQGTDTVKELDVVKYILARESILLKLKNLCHEINQCDVLVQSSTALESELLDTLALMRETTTNYLDILTIWRESCTQYEPHNPRKFVWDGQNYTLKVTRDLDFLADQALLVSSLQLQQTKMLANPLMLPNTLEEGDTWIDPLQRASTDAGGDTEGFFFEERLRVRRAERVLLMELELSSDRESLR